MSGFSSGNRSVVLDTETTGMPVTDGHRIIEIGCVELDGRRLTGRHFHVYLQPDREVDEGAIAVHGITNEFLKDKPRFREVADEFFEFINGAQLIIHNAAFDVGFINNEFALLGQQERAEVYDYCGVLDTLRMARERHPGQRNNLDALCKRYGVDNSGRDLHGALLDSEILADVYLAMTGGQTSLSLAGNGSDADGSGRPQASAIRRLSADRARTRVIRASEEELAAHLVRLAVIEKSAGAPALWAQMEAPKE
ncbi:DNA polymerase III subunit epsilon [compost metagenome]